MERCSTCNRKCEPVVAKDRRVTAKCSICAAHYELRTRYDNQHYRNRSNYLSRVAMDSPKQSKHCPGCHHFRHKSEFLRFSDLYGECSLCRELKALAALETKREVRKAVANRERIAKMYEGAADRYRAASEEAERELARMREADNAKG